MSIVVSFEVVGIPKPQGSKKAFSVGGQARMKEAGGLAFAQWRNAVASAAKDAAASTGTLDGPLGLSVEFRFPMIRSRPKRDRERGWVHKTTAPDLDKLVRCLCDGLTASGLIADDARICALEATKIEVTTWTGATVRITQETTP